MLEVADALKIVLEHASALSPVRVPLRESLGKALAEPIVADVDSPPHDKSLVDGYAVRAAEVDGQEVTLNVVEEITAGQIPSQAVAVGQASRIMTGAPIPIGADAVVMVENTKLDPAALPLPRVTISAAPLAPGRNILPLGSEFRRNDTVLYPRHVVTPAAIGLLAEVGKRDVLVQPQPTVAILATGNELVPFHETPTPGQIRNSNGPLLEALIRSFGGRTIDLGIARDERDALRTKLAAGLQADFLIVSGGVSAGVLDLVPGVLEDLGVKQLFHRINLKPGRPLWCGEYSRGGRDRLVFGLPGNPVSTLVCCQLFVRPAFEVAAGLPVRGMARQMGKLAGEFVHKGNRPTYYPGRRVPELGSREVATLPWQGSADLHTLSQADCLIHFPAGNYSLAAGADVEVCWM